MNLLGHWNLQIPPTSSTDYPSVFLSHGGLDHEHDQGRCDCTSRRLCGMREEERRCFDSTAGRRVCPDDEKCSEAKLRRTTRREYSAKTRTRRQSQKPMNARPTRRCSEPLAASRSSF